MLKRTLGTKDVKVAKRLIPAVTVEVDAFLSQYVQQTDLSPAQVQEIANNWMAHWLALDAQVRLDPEATRLPPEDLEAMGAEARTDLAVADLSAMTDEARDFAEDSGLPHLTPNSLRSLAHAFLRAEVVLEKRRAERAAGHWREDEQGVSVASSLEVPRVAPVVPAPSKASPLLSEVHARWKAERKPNNRTALEWETAIRRFKELRGDLPVSQITKGDIAALKDSLVAAGKAPATILKQLAALRSVLGWAMDNDLITTNPATGVRLRVAKVQTDTRLPYDDADLKVIFGLPVFTSAERPKAGGGEAAYWLPLLALFTGARLNELGQLMVSDIKERDGTAYIDISNDGEGQSVKTEGSKREVPIHPTLETLGFLKYAASQPPAGRLFPQVVPDSTGNHTGSWSKWWGRYQRAQGVKDNRKVFHSFRHRFIDACRAARIEEEVRNAITGHASGNVGRGYGSGVPLEVKRDAIALVSFGKLDLSHLMP